jgi:hypothetical protein
VNRRRNTPVVACPQENGVALAWLATARLSSAGETPYAPGCTTVSDSLEVFEGPWIRVRGFVIVVGDVFVNLPKSESRSRKVT